MKLDLGGLIYPILYLEMRLLVGSCQSIKSSERIQEISKDCLIQNTNQKPTKPLIVVPSIYQTSQLLISKQIDNSCTEKSGGHIMTADSTSVRPTYIRLHPSGWEDVLPCLAMAMWYPQGWTAMANIYRIFLPRVLMPFSVSCFSPASMPSTSKQKCLILGHWDAPLFSPALNISMKLDSLICR